MADTGTRWHWGAQDDALTVALASGCSYEQAAKRSGYSIRTAKRRAADPRFARRIQSLRDDVTKRIAAHLAELADDACNALGDLLSKDAGEGARLQAAKVVLDFAGRARVDTELVERIEQLERQRAGLRAVG